MPLLLFENSAAFSMTKIHNDCNRKDKYLDEKNAKY